jgi:hypothetical protein
MFVDGYCMDSGAKVGFLFLSHTKWRRKYTDGVIVGVFAWLCGTFVWFKSCTFATDY